MKGAGLQRVKLPPRNWFAPPGSNRSGSGDNEAVGAFDVEGRMAVDSEPAESPASLNYCQSRNPRAFISSDLFVLSGLCGELE